MKKQLLKLALIAGMLAMGITAKAQLYSYSTDYTDPTTKMLYSLDKTNKKAEFRGFNEKDAAPAEVHIPDVVTVDGEDYEIVEIGHHRYSYYNGYEQTTLQELYIDGSHVERLNGGMLYSFPNVKRIDVPASVKTAGGSVFGSRSDIVVNFKGKPIVFEGDLTGSSSYHLYLTVDQKYFADYEESGTVYDGWIKTDYAEDHCIVCRPTGSMNVDLSLATYHTGEIESGELGYSVVANALPKIITYSMVNKLVVDGGTMNNDDWYAIRHMPNLVELDLSNVDIETIPEGALRDCWQLNKVILPNKLKTIKGSAFYNVGFNGPLFPEESFTNFPAEITFDGTYTFAYCRMLKALNIGTSKCYSLPSYFAYYCHKLTEATIYDEVKTIGGSAFYDCDLREIVIPSKLKIIDSHTFYSNNNLAKIIFNVQGGETERVEYRAFSYAEKVTDIVFPNSMRYIGQQSFEGNTSLKNITFNEGLEELYTYAFSGCEALEEITLPSSLLRATSAPFTNCPNLMKIKAMSILPPTVGNYVITSTAGNRQLYVPMWSFQEYAVTPGWLEFQDHMVVDPTILPKNVYINKEFEMVLDESKMDYSSYHPNIKLFNNSEEISDGFGHTKYQRGNLTVSSKSFIDADKFEMTFSPFAKYQADRSKWYGSGYDYDYYRTVNNPNSLVVRERKTAPGQPTMRAQSQEYTLQLQNDLWQFVSFPFNVYMNDIIPENDQTQWVIREYDGSARAKADFANTWVELKGSPAAPVYKFTGNANDGGVVYAVNPTEQTALYLGMSDNTATEHVIRNFNANGIDYTVVELKLDVKYPNLKTLEINTPSIRNYDLNAIKAAFPNLETLKLPYWANTIGNTYCEVEFLGVEFTPAPGTPGIGEEIFNCTEYAKGANGLEYLVDKEAKGCKLIGISSSFTGQKLVCGYLDGYTLVDIDFGTKVYPNITSISLCHASLTNFDWNKFKINFPNVVEVRLYANQTIDNAFGIQVVTEETHKDNHYHIANVGGNKGHLLIGGKGYVMKCYAGSGYGTSTPVNFTLTPSTVDTKEQAIFNYKDIYLELPAYDGKDVVESDRSWSLIGNPYPCYYDTRYLKGDKTDLPFGDGYVFLVWDSYNKTYKACSTTKDTEFNTPYILNPGESFFIQRPTLWDDDERLQYQNTGRQTYRNANDLTVDAARAAKASADKTVRKGFNLVLTDGEFSDQTQIVLNDKATTKYEAGRDASKMMSDEAAVQLWTVNNNVNYAINERPLGAGLVPMSVNCAKAGQFTIMLGERNSEGYDVFVEDKAMGTTTQITSESGYTFTAAAGTTNGRFVVKFQATETTGIEAVATAENADVETPAYNVAGQKVNASAKGIVLKNGKKIIKK